MREYNTLKNIQPWATVKALIEKKFDVAKRLQNQIQQLGSDETLDSDEQTKTRLKTPTEDIPFQTAVILPQGFIPLKILRTSKPTLRNAQYVPYNMSMETIVTLDSHQCIVWKGSQRAHTLSTHVGHKKDGKKQSSMAGIRNWVFVQAWSVFIIANMQMEMKVFLFINPKKIIQ